MKIFLLVIFIFFTGLVISCYWDDCFYCSGGRCTFCSGYSASERDSCPNCAGTYYCRSCQGTGKIDNFANR